MDDNTNTHFQKVAERLGWAADGGLELTEKQLMRNIGKSRHCAVARQGNDGTATAHPATCPQLSDSESSGKENGGLKGQSADKVVLLDSSDDDFDLVLLKKTTPKPAARRPLCPSEKNSACEKSSLAQVVSSDSDDSFENFLIRVQTPKIKPARQCGSEDSLKQFIVDRCSSDEDFVVDRRKKKPASRGNQKTPRPAQLGPPTARRAPSEWESPVFVSDEDDDVAIKSTWKSRHAVRGRQEAGLEAGQQRMEATPASPVPPVLARPSSFRTPIQLDDSDSEEEFQSLLERLKRNHSVGVKTGTPASKSELLQKPSSLLVPSEHGLKTEGGGEKKHQPGKRAQSVNTPVQRVSRPAVSHTEPRPAPGNRSVVCKTPGCFLQSLSTAGSLFCRSFKQHKEELTGRLYRLYNSSVFEGKLPAGMSVSWNKKMRKTAGYCITGQERSTGIRYARIELSEKVCDSADRLRDTLVHEMCHAATWLINGVRDGHGSFWKLYARRATVAHPELPMVTRCHSYDINYKYQYQCNRCKNTIGRHSKSLDTQRFVCALCTGQLVLLTPSKPRGPTPFASFVKEHYGSVRQELAGQGHAEVMRKLSADFASKTQLSRS